MNNKLAILTSASLGNISICEAAARLAFPDGGHVFEALAAENLPLPSLSELELHEQAAASLKALSECLK